MKYLLLNPSLLAGLGDSILALIQAISYARLSNRTLCVDWRGGVYGMPHDVNLFDRIFEIKGIPYTKHIPEGQSVYPHAWKNSTHKTFEQVREDNNFTGWDLKTGIEKYSFDVSKFDYQEEILVMWDFQQFDKLINPLFENGIIHNTSSKYIASGEVFNQFATLRDILLKYLEESWVETILGTNDTKIIGVHIRDTKESMDCFGVLKRKRYFTAVDSIFEKDPETKYIFLATDNKDAQREFSSRYGNKIRYKGKWFKSPGNPIHMSLEDCPDKWENILNALFEMFALSRCDYLIRRKASSFSRVSQSIGMIEDRNTILINRGRTIVERIINRLSTTKQQLIEPLRKRRLARLEN